MTKRKKKLSEIKDALLSNTSYINNIEEQTDPVETAENMIEIEKQVFSKIKLLSKYYEKDPASLINEALAHYLRLKKLDINEALKNMLVGSADDD